MQPYRSRKPRPTVNDARDAIDRGITGGYSPTDSIDDNERIRLLDELSQDLEQTIADNFPETDNLEYAILKCHLLVEYTIVRYISCMSFHQLDPESIRFTFAQKLDVAAMLGFGAYCDLTIPSVELLNRVRNQVAHRFTIDRTIIDEIYRWWTEDPDVVDTATDEDRIGFLAWFCSFLAGSISGKLKAHAYMNTKVPVEELD